MTIVNSNLNRIIAILSASGFFILYTYYRYIKNDGKKDSVSDDPNSQRLKTDASKKIRDQLSDTQRTIRELQLEVERLRRHIFFKEHSAAKPGGRRKFKWFSKGLPKSKSIGSIESARNEFRTPSLSENRVDEVIENRLAPSLMPFNTSTDDDNDFYTPMGGASLSSSNTSTISECVSENISEMAVRCIDSMKTLVGDLPIDFEYIYTSYRVYNPIPSSTLPDDIQLVCEEMDEMYSLGDEGVERSFVLVQRMAEEQVLKYVEILWRMCRAALWLRTVYVVKKDPTQTAFYVEQGLKYSKAGLNVLKLDEANGLPTSLELCVTRSAPMYKWAGSCIGCSAEFVSGINEKIKAGFESLDLFTKATEIDPKDYITWYNIARWHWEICKLSSTLKRAANWISTRKYDSTVENVLQSLEQFKLVYPYKYPFLNEPPEIPTLYACCYKEKREKALAKNYALEARKLFDQKYKDEKVSLVDGMTSAEIDDLIAALT